MRQQRQAAYSSLVSDARLLIDAIQRQSDAIGRDLFDQSPVPHVTQADGDRDIQTFSKFSLDVANVELVGSDAAAKTSVPLRAVLSELATGIVIDISCDKGYVQPANGKPPLSAGGCGTTYSYGDELAKANRCLAYFIATGKHDLIGS